MLTAQREEVRDETEGDALRETFNIREREGEEDLTNVADINWIG